MATTATLIRLVPLLWLAACCKGFIPGLTLRSPEVCLHSNDVTDDDPLQGKHIFFDIEVQGTPLGRLVFDLADPSPLPLHTENLVKLCEGGRRGIDPLAHYVGCDFDYSPSTIEDGSGRYRWGHILKGRGRNAIGRADELIVDKKSQLACTHTCFGGQYYGIKYDANDDNHSVVLAVPVLGPGHGSSRFSILRVKDSPPEWRERLLLNSGVVGFLAPDCHDILRAMARQRLGPPKVVASGLVL
jgi:hypothetical protein